MRILAIHPAPAFSVADVHAGWVEAFRALGHTVADLNLDDRLNFYAQAHVQSFETKEWVKAFDDKGAVRMASKGIHAACYEFAPDLCFITSGFFVPLDTMRLMRHRGTTVVLCHTESPYEDDRQLRRATHADVNILNDPTNLSRFPDASYYQPASYRPSVHHSREPKADLASDVCFVGTGYESRIAFLEAVDWSGIDVALAGNWQQLGADSPLRPFVAHEIEACIDNADAHDLYASTKVGLNLYRQESERPELAQGWAMGPREVELAAAGVFFLRAPRTEGDAVLKMLPTFREPDELGAEIRSWIARPQDRREVAAQAREAVADRTFENAARTLMAKL